MTAEKKERQPLQIKNLADLKRHIKVGTELVATAHLYHPDIVGLTRVVTKVQANGFYSKIKDQPEHKWSTCNQGMGFWSPFNKAGAYHFTDSTVQVLNTRKNDGSVLYEMELYDSEQSMSEQNKEVPDMNEWDRLHRQAQRCKEAYPPGTRIMLLGMGNDPNPVESGTRGTVRVVDDIGTLHCDFDNGRSLGVVPGEDSFRKLTDEELAEEQAEDMASGAEDPVFFYFKLNTETNGVGHIIKTSEDGKVEGIKFTITGNGVNQTVVTGKNGTVDLDLLPGTYTVTEQTDDKYETQAAQTVTIVSGTIKPVCQSCMSTVKEALVKSILRLMPMASWRAHMSIV